MERAGRYKPRRTQRRRIRSAPASTGDHHEDGHGHGDLFVAEGISDGHLRRLCGTRDFRSVTHLNLRYDPAEGGPPPDLVVSRLPSLIRLVLDGSSIPSIRDLGLLGARSPNLRSVSLSDAGLVDLDGICGALPHVSELRLCDNGIEDVTALATHERLRDLDLKRNRVGWGGFALELLGTCRALESLDLRDNPISAADSGISETIGGEDYRRVAACHIPHLIVLDGRHVDRGDDDDEVPAGGSLIDSRFSWFPLSVKRSTPSAEESQGDGIPLERIPKPYGDCGTDSIAKSLQLSPNATSSPVHDSPGNPKKTRGWVSPERRRPGEDLRSWSPELLQGSHHLAGGVAGALRRRRRRRIAWQDDDGEVERDDLEDMGRPGKLKCANGADGGSKIAQGGKHLREDDKENAPCFKTSASPTIVRDNGSSTVEEHMRHQPLFHRPCVGLYANMQAPKQPASSSAPAMLEQQRMFRCKGCGSEIHEQDISTKDENEVDTTEPPSTQLRKLNLDSQRRSRFFAKSRNGSRIVDFGSDNDSSDSSADGCHEEEDMPNQQYNHLQMLSPPFIPQEGRESDLVGVRLIGKAERKWGEVENNDNIQGRDKIRKGRTDLRSHSLGYLEQNRTHHYGQGQMERLALCNQCYRKGQRGRTHRYSFSALPSCFDISDCDSSTD